MFRGLFGLYYVIILLAFTIMMSLFSTSYHHIIVSRKNISYAGFFNTSHLLLLCHYFSLRIIVSRKKCLTQDFSKTSPSIYYSPLLYVVIILNFISSYHEKIFLTQAFSIPRIHYYYVIIFHFVSLYHEKITRMNFNLIINKWRVYIYH